MWQPSLITGFRLDPLTVCVLLSTLSISSTSAQRADSSFFGDPASGRQIFTQRGCVRCHSIWGNGGTLGPDFALVGAGRSLQQLAGLFWNHTPRMIETVRERGVQWPTFSEQGLADIISYIYYVKLFDPPGNPDFGERWFREKRCVECHTIGGRGASVGPALDDYASFIAPIMLAEGMWNHGPSMQARQLARGLRIPRFEGRELADLQAYIRRESSDRRNEVAFLTPPNPRTGERLFATKGCIRCHGLRGRGTSHGPDLRRATERLQVSEIAGTLWNHSSQMAAAMRARQIDFPRFQGTEMADVIAFLYYLRFYETGGNASTGERVFREKGCVSCHVTGGIGPDLSQSEATQTALALATAMWNHAPAMYDHAQIQHVVWPHFEGEEMRDLSMYLRSLVASGSR